MDVARSSSKVFLAEVFGTILSLVGLTYFARELGTGELGSFFLFQALLFFFGLPADMGIRTAVEKRISEGTAPASVLSTALVVKGGLLALTLTGVFLARNYVNSYIGYDLAAFLAVALVLQEVSGLLKNVLSGELRVGETAVIDFANTLTKYGVGVALVYAGHGVIGLIVGVIGGLSVRLILAFRARDTKFGRPRTALVRSLGNYAKYTVIPSLGRQVNQRMDLLIIGLFLTTEAAGVYEIAWRIGGPVLLLARSIGVAIFPQFSSWESADSRDAIGRLFSRVITPSLLLVFPAFFGTVVLARDILSVVFGPDYVTGWLALVIILAGKIPDAVRSLMEKSLYGLNHPKYTTVATTMTIGANLVLNVVLVLQFGIVGAAVGTSVAVTIGTSVLLYYLSRLIDIAVPYDELGWCLAASAVMAGVLYAAKTTVAVDTVPRLAAFVVAGAVLYGSFVLLYPPLKDQITTQLRKTVPWSP